MTKAAATALSRPGVTLEAANANARTTPSRASAPVAAATVSGSQRRSARENCGMAAVSQGLAEFANGHRPPAGPGVEVVDTPVCRMTFQPDYPVPGPNSAAWVRCEAKRVDAMVDQVRSLFRSRRLPLMWILDPGHEPADLPARLVARGARPDPTSPEVAVMVLPSESDLEAPVVEGLAIEDALADVESFRAADAVNAEAFGSAPRAQDAEQRAAQERRRRSQLAAGNRRLLLVTVHGEPAGSAGISLYPPAGATINGGAVRPAFRGRGVYRAMVVERLRMAREAGAAGLSVWGGPMSAPILARLGFVKVGWRKFFLDA
jgi:GNAT superfamily N-acetyltransferase